MIDVPELPPLRVNSPPTRLTLSAKPDRNLVLNLIRDDIKSFHVVPLSVTFSQNSTSQNISISANKPGIYQLKFTVDEDLDIEDIPPASVRVTDGNSSEPNYFIRNEVEHGLLVPGKCLHADDINKTGIARLDIKCPNDNDLFFNSTRKWSTKGTVNSQGIIFSNNNGFLMPVAILGAKLSKPMEGGPYIDLDSLNTFELTHGCNRQNSDTCEDRCLSVNDLNSILFYESLAFTYLHQSRALIPKWLRLKALSSNRTAHNMHSYMVNLVYNDGFEFLQDCNELTAITKGLHSILIYTGSLHIQLNNETRELNSSKVPVCFATNLCEGAKSPLYMTIPNDAQSELESLQFMQDLKRKGWTTYINSLAISDSTINVEPHSKSLYWNGMQYFQPDQVTPNMVATVKFTKSFYVNDSFEVEWYFDGNVELVHKDFNEVCMFVYINVCILGV